ncbi:MAG: LysM peptidoglycan-binding domain-containing protein [Planctomycetota bacterium]
MALPSQSPRVTRYGYRPARKRPVRRTPRVFLLLLLVLAAAGWLVIVNLPGGDASGEERLAQETGEPTPAPPAETRPSETTLRLASAQSRELERERPRQRARPEREPSLPELVMGSAESSVPVRTAPAETTSQPPRTNESTRATGTPVRTGTGLSARAQQALQDGDPIEARDLWNRAAHDPLATASERAMARARLDALNEDLLFTPRVVQGDPLVLTYSIKSGDSLAKIARLQNLAVDWRLIARINGIDNPNRIRVGQTLKLIRGPFHGVVSKSAYRLDIYAEQLDSAGNRLLVRSFACGLGEYGSTPVGSWVVRGNSKLVNPAWVNPRTGERFGADDPMNPIGERWIGLDGTDPETELMTGYGIHGTIEPESIGREASMGCVRLRSGDVELVYELLAEGQSTVEILP